MPVLSIAEGRKKGAALREALAHSAGSGCSEIGGEAEVAPPPSTSGSMVPLPEQARGGAKEGRPSPRPSPASGRGGSGAPIPDFTPVPRRYRHDGWTPERQKAFIEALADTGCVTRAAGMQHGAGQCLFAAALGGGRGVPAGVGRGIGLRAEAAEGRGLRAGDRGECQANHAGGMVQDCEQSGLALGAGNVRIGAEAFTPHDREHCEHSPPKFHCRGTGARALAGGICRQPPGRPVHLGPVLPENRPPPGVRRGAGRGARAPDARGGRARGARLSGRRAAGIRFPVRPARARRPGARQFLHQRALRRLHAPIPIAGRRSRASSMRSPPNRRSRS